MDVAVVDVEAAEAAAAAGFSFFSFFSAFFSFFLSVVAFSAPVPAPAPTAFDLLLVAIAAAPVLDVEDACGRSGRMMKCKKVGGKLNEEKIIYI